jgi:Zn-dependent M32 family carboxypeptidase
MSNNPEILYNELQSIDFNQVDPVQGAEYRAEAQAAIANPSIALKLRRAIADLLIQANQQLTFKTIGKDDNSY